MLENPREAIQAGELGILGGGGGKRRKAGKSLQEKAKRKKSNREVKRLS